jgi:hypothetical protein
MALCSKGTFSNSSIYTENVNHELRRFVALVEKYSEEVQNKRGTFVFNKLYATGEHKAVTVDEWIQNSSFPQIGRNIILKVWQSLV